MISKIYIATDSSPVDMQSYELCSDAIDVILDMSSIYAGQPTADEANTIIRLNNGMVVYARQVNT